MCHGCVPRARSVRDWKRQRFRRLQTPDVALKYGHDLMQLALHGGDDYELLFTFLRAKQSSAEVLSRCASHPHWKNHPKAGVAGAGRERPREAPHTGGWDPFR